MLNYYICAITCLIMFKEANLYLFHVLKVLYNLNLIIKKFNTKLVQLKNNCVIFIFK